VSALATERRAEYERELAAYIVRVVDAAPALSRAQADALALLFRRPRDTRRAA
jgi:hypothetical protein